MSTLTKMLKSTNFKGSQSGENNDSQIDLRHNILCEPDCFLTILFALAFTDVFGPFACSREESSANIPPSQSTKTKDPLKSRYASRDK